jgi:hypothetical protein
MLWSKFINPSPLIPFPPKITVQRTPTFLSVHFRIFFSFFLFPFFPFFLGTDQLPSNYSVVSNDKYLRRTYVGINNDSRTSRPPYLPASSPLRRASHYPQYSMYLYIHPSIHPSIHRTGGPYDPGILPATSQPPPQPQPQLQPLTLDLRILLRVGASGLRAESGAEEL